MTYTNRDRFERAYAAWVSDPVTSVTVSSDLRTLSDEVIDSQTAIAPVLTAYYERGEIVPPPIESGQWLLAPDWQFGRAVRRLRRLMQSGRHQVATRSLLKQTELVQEAWRAYRACVGR